MNQEIVRALRAVRQYVADDALAIAFQSTGQYRTALLKYIALMEETLGSEVR